MSIEAIRCVGCRELVEVKELEKHYASNHREGIVKGATTITTANPTYLPPGPPHAYPSAYPPRPHAFDSPIWGPFLRRYFPHMMFGAFAIGVIVGILLW